MNVPLTVTALIVIGIIIMVLERPDKPKKEKEEIAYIDIPPLTGRIEILAYRGDRAINFSYYGKFENGDIIITNNGKKSSYYVRAHGMTYKLSIRQVKMLEKEYKMKIL